MDDHLRALHLLRTEPTEARWKEELRTVFYGKRDARIRRLGGIQEYLEGLHRNSTDPSESRKAFHAALRDFVTEWQPGKFQSTYYVELMLDLLAAFTPGAGFVKLVEQLRSWDVLRPIGADRATLIRLHSRALEVLQRYFGAPPPGKDEASWAAFQSYIDILRDNLDRPEHCGVALARLIDLHVVEVDSEEVRESLRANPHAMLDLVNQAFHSGNERRLKWYLSQLHQIAIQLGGDVAEIFQQAVAECDASLHDRDGFSVIELPSGAEVPLEPPPDNDDAIITFLEMRKNRGESAFAEYLDDVS